MDTSRPTGNNPVSSRKTSAVRSRQHRSLEMKRQIVEETLAPGASVAVVARNHGVNANQVFGWRRLYRQGLLENGNDRTPTLLPVRVVPEAASEGQRGSGTARPPLGVMQIELPKGRLRLSGGVDVAALQVVLEKLLA